MAHKIFKLTNEDFMSLNVKDETLIKTLLERYSIKDLFCLLAKKMTPKNRKEAIVAIMDTLEGFDVEEMVDICLSSKEGQKHTDEVTLEFIDQVFDNVWLKKIDECKDIWNFERDCYPSLWSLRDRIESHYHGEDFIDTFYESDLINHLEGTQEFDDYIEEIEDRVRREVEEEYEEEEKEEEITTGHSTKLLEMTPDDAWMWCANQAGCSYYDGNALEKWADAFTDHIDRSSFAQIIMREKIKD